MKVLTIRKEVKLNPVKMKRIFILTISICSLSLAKGQFFDNNSIYLSSGLNLGNYFGGTFGINYLYKEKFAMQISLSGNMRKAKKAPFDYSMGVFNALFFGIDQPYEHFESYITYWQEEFFILIKMVS